MTAPLPDPFQTIEAGSLPQSHLRVLWGRRSQQLAESNVNSRQSLYEPWKNPLHGAEEVSPIHGELSRWRRMQTTFETIGFWRSSLAYGGKMLNGYE
jgi:hypothetical protein